MRIFALVFAIAILMPATGAWSCELFYAGSSTIGMGVLSAGAVEEFRRRTGIRFAVVENSGSGKGIKALLNGGTPLAGTSRFLTAEEKRNKLVGKVIGYDAIAVFVHVDNPVESLTKRELKEIFSGRVTNWKDVGGRSAPIRPTTEVLTGSRGTMEMFQEIVMEGAPYGSGFREIEFPRDQIIDLASDVNGICAVSLGLLAAVPPEVRAKVKAVGVNGIRPHQRSVKNGSYLISRPLLLVTRGAPRGPVKDFMDFMVSLEGQSFVARNFVPVKP